jgi:hypothetical protein
MADELRASPPEIVKLGRTTIDASLELGDRQRDAQTSLHVPASAFGKIASADVARSHGEACTAADITLTTLGEVYEGDADSLYQTAMNYHRADFHTQSQIDSLITKIDPRHWWDE